MDSEIQFESDFSLFENEDISHEILQTMEETLSPSGIKEIEQGEQTAELSYMCILCRKTFKTSQERVIHIRTHSGAKPYTCNICEKRFSQQSNLTTHMRTHSGVILQMNVILVI